MRAPPEIAAEMMKPYAGSGQAWEVNADEGNVRNNRRDLMDRLALL